MTSSRYDVEEFCCYLSQYGDEPGSLDEEQIGDIIQLFSVTRNCFAASSAVLRERELSKSANAVGVLSC